jgi:hypothetical protein
MSRRMRRVVIGGVVLALITAASAFAGKPSSPSPTLSVSFPPSASASTATSSMPYGTPYVVSGCGYTSYVTIVVTSPEAIAVTGQTPDASGCLSVTNFSTQGPGHYKIEAWEQLRNKSSIVASTDFDVG